MQQEALPHYGGSDGYPGPSNHMMDQEPFTMQEIRLMRQVSGFGFRIIGGKEEGSQVCVCLSISLSLSHECEVLHRKKNGQISPPLTLSLSRPQLEP